jgi:beta-lactamase class A
MVHLRSGVGGHRAVDVSELENMMNWKSRVLFVALAVAVQTAGAQETVLSAYRKAVEKRIKESQADVAIAFVTLDGKTEYFFRADDSFHAASTMKIPVMIELFHQVKDRRLRLTDTLMIHNEFHSIVDNSLYQLAPNDDSETDLYKAEGESRELGYLCELMITRSSNLATNLLIEKLGVEDIRATVHSLGAGRHARLAWRRRSEGL